MKETNFDEKLQKSDNIVGAQPRGTNTGRDEALRWATGDASPVAETKGMETTIKAAKEVTSKFGMGESSYPSGESLQFTDKRILEKLNTVLDTLSGKEKVERLKGLLKEDELEAYARWKDGKEDELFDIYAPGDMAIGMQEMWHVNSDLQKTEINMLLKIKKIKEMEVKLDDIQRSNYEGWIRENREEHGNFSHPDEYDNFRDQQLQKLQTLEKQTN